MIEEITDIDETDEGTETTPKPLVISEGPVWTSGLGRSFLIATGAKLSPRGHCGSPVNLPWVLVIY